MCIANSRGDAKGKALLLSQTKSVSNSSHFVTNYKRSESLGCLQTMPCQQKTSLQASVAPEDLKETIESEDEDEGRTPQVEVKQHKEESAKESESGEDKEAKES